MKTSYDVVAYPSAIFIQSDPERLAVVAQLHGLSPPDPETARVLEIGCGDGLNLLAFAAARPRARFHGFDLAQSAIVRGRDLAANAGLTNVTLETLDILDARSHLAARSFDYVIAHGVYAWVPDAVREALMVLVGHVLADDGVAFVSYNANPGGHVRMIMREMLLPDVGHITDFDEKIARTRSLLEAVAARESGDDAVKEAIRAQAESMLSRHASVLFHDELGPFYHPQSLTTVVKDAERNGLRFLSDAGRNRLLDGFLTDDATDDAEAAVVKQAQARDFADMRFFRHTLFVRDHHKPDRAIKLERMSRLYCSSDMTRDEDGVFHHDKDRIEIADPAFADRLEALRAQFPCREPIDVLALNEEAGLAYLQMYAEWYVGLHVAPAPFAHSVPEFPRTSPLIRAQIQSGATNLCTLAHKRLDVRQEELRRLLLAADGTRSVAMLQEDHTIGFSPEDVRGALSASVQRALICRD